MLRYPHEVVSQGRGFRIEAWALDSLGVFCPRCCGQIHQRVGTGLDFLPLENIYKTILQHHNFDG